MAIAFSGNQHDYTSTSKLSSHTNTFGFTAALNRLLVACISCDDLISTPAGWSLAKSQLNFAQVSIIYKVSDGTETQVVVTCASAAQMVISVREYTGALTVQANVLDQTNGANVTGTATSTGTTGTTVQADELIVGAWANDQTRTYSATTGGTVTANSLTSTGTTPNVRLHAADLVALANTTYEMHATASGSANCCACIATFRAAETAPVVQQQTGVGTTSATATLLTAAIAANLLVAIVWESGASNPGAATLTGYTSMGSNAWNTNLNRLEVFYKVAAGGETTVAPTNASATGMQVHAFELTGMSGTPADQFAIDGAHGSAGVLTIGTGTTGVTAQANEFSIVAAGMAGAITALSWSNSYALVMETDRLHTGSLLLAATGTQTSTATWTTSRTAAGLIATFKLASSFFPPPPLVIAQQSLVAASVW